MDILQAVGIDIWLILKYLVLFSLFLYVIFALVVVRQIQLMTDTLEVGFETPVRFLGFFHLLFALGTLIIAFMVL